MRRTTWVCNDLEILPLSKTVPLPPNLFSQQHKGLGNVLQVGKHNSDRYKTCYAEHCRTLPSSVLNNAVILSERHSVPPCFDGEVMEKRLIFSTLHCSQAPFAGTALMQCLLPKHTSLQDQDIEFAAAELPENCDPP